jgi:uncharacterized OB-fold protein
VSGPAGVGDPTAGVAEPVKRPIPRPDNASAEYWKAQADGRLLYQQCPKCGNRQLYPRSCCTACGETPEWQEASGRGTVHTFTIIRQNYAQPFRDMLPYVVAIIELEEGPRLMSNVTDCDVADVRIGMPVEAYTLDLDEEVGLTLFRPAKDA